MQDIRWHADFEDLPYDARVCRHELTCEFDDRKCDRAFDCRHCPTHGTLVHDKPEPEGRLFHRGHTWVERQPDGSYTIGMDELGQRLTAGGTVKLPPAGTHLRVNGTAWYVERDGVPLRILSPIDGEVLESGADTHRFFLRVRPDGKVNVKHLLSGPEVHPWTVRERDRLQLLLTRGPVGATMADGGMPVGPVPAEVCAEMFLCAAE